MNGSVGAVDLQFGECGAEMARKVTPAKSAIANPPIFSKLSLIENSYDFLNQSLRHYRKARRNVHEWPFALLHITQSIELMLKHVLRQTHPILIFEDIDHPRRTVSLEQALKRLETVARVAVGDKEKVNIQRAADYRNKIVHYEFELNRFDCKNTFAQLFEFVHFFHDKYLKHEIHAHIARDMWPTESRLMMYFKSQFVVYNGIEMSKYNPAEILDAQRETYFERDGQKFYRSKYGEEPGWSDIDPNFADIPCHDCGVVKVQYNAESCDVEQCPRCRHQLLGCACCW
jgi:HEPN domain-containing protein